MTDKKLLAETAALVAAALLCALGANLVASRERKLPVVGHYPNALAVPPRAVETPSLPAADPAAGRTPDAPAAAAAPAPSTGGGPAVAGTPGPLPRPTARPADRATAPERPAAPAPSGEAELLARFPAHPDRVFLEISGEDAAWLHARGALFLDARRTKVYEEGHVAGALGFAVWESDVADKVFALLGEGRSPTAPLVVYCSGGDCEDSHMLSERLFGAGFTNVLVYKDGWPDWQRRGGAGRTGPEP